VTGSPICFCQHWFTEFLFTFNIHPYKHKHSYKECTLLYCNKLKSVVVSFLLLVTYTSALFWSVLILCLFFLTCVMCFPKEGICCLCPGSTESCISQQRSVRSLVRTNGQLRIKLLPSVIDFSLCRNWDGHLCYSIKTWRFVVGSDNGLYLSYCGWSLYDGKLAKLNC